MEKWKNLKGFEGMYIISDKGRIFSIISNHMLTFKSSKGENKYIQADLVDKNGAYGRYYVHRLVAMTYIPNTGRLPEVNHKDGNKRNNCVENLEWVCHQDNVIHSYQELGHKKPYSLKPKPRIVKGVKVDNDKEIVYFRTVREAAEAVDVTESCIYVAIRHKTTSANYRWEYVDNPEYIAYMKEQEQKEQSK